MAHRTKPRRVFLASSETLKADVRQKENTMFKKFKEIFVGKPRPPNGTTYKVPGLGELKFNDDVDLWEIEAVKDGDTIIFGVGDKIAPNLTLIQHAITILEDYTAFRRIIMDFLNSERSKFKGYEDEISQLAIESISLHHPQSPNDGAIYFNGPNEFRVWRCGFSERKPRDLGFDD